MIHKLKTVDPYFNEIRRGEKIFEVRKNDRNFKVGDILTLQNINHKKEFTGLEVSVKVTYILDNPEYCKDGYVIMGFEKLDYIY